MTLYGTPETAQRMMDNMAKGFGMRAMAEGFLNGANPSANGTGSGVDAVLGSLGKLVGPAVEKLTGQAVDGVAKADAIAKALASNPDALKSIAEALTSTDAPAKESPLTPNNGGTGAAELTVKPGLKPGAEIELAAAPKKANRE